MVVVWQRTSVSTSDLRRQSKNGERGGLLDGFAISLSTLCLLHCLALPVIAAALPALSMLADAEWAHWMFVALAVPTSIFALKPANRTAFPRDLVTIAAIALTLLVAGAAEVGTSGMEVPLTVLGSIALAVAHSLNWLRHTRQSRPGAHGHRQGLQPVAEPLRAFADRRDHVERKIERRLALAIESSAGKCGTLARERRERPCRIMTTVAAPDEPQAKPPSAT